MKRYVLPPRRGLKTDRILLHLPEAEWPDEDRIRFAAAFRQAYDLFADDGSGNHLRPRTKAAIWYGYRRWLGWIKCHQANLMGIAPDCRVTPETAKDYVRNLRDSCVERTIADYVGRLYNAIRYMYPKLNWDWLKILKTRLERAIPKRSRAPIHITSQGLIDAGLRRLDDADLEREIAVGRASRGRHQDLALRYRDSLLVALAGFFPLRRSNLADLMIGTTITRGTTGWGVELPGNLVKNGEPISAELPPWIGERVDRFLAVYRPLICRSNTHTGLWASAKGCPATGDALYLAFKKEVAAALDMDMTLHDVRRVAGTTWAVHDPVNAAGVKDLIGDRSERVMSEHYILASGIEASRSKAALIEKLKQNRLVRK